MKMNLMSPASRVEVMCGTAELVVEKFDKAITKE